MRALRRLLRKDGFYVLGIAAIAYFTYFRNYAAPPYLYWDENYHVASAQKYLSGVFFMENHPPLGKLLIAAGEALMKPNRQEPDGNLTDYITRIPPNFSFRGYRLFPVMLSW